MQGMFLDNVEDIKSLLRLEIASKVFGAKTGIEIGLNDDPVVTKAVELMKDWDSYAVNILPMDK